MKLEPKGNWIQVDLDFDEKEKEAEKVLIALPDDYKPEEKPYKAVTVISDSQTGPKRYKAGAAVIVPTHVIRDVEVGGNKFYFVERNHIMAVVTKAL